MPVRVKTYGEKAAWLVENGRRLPDGCLVSHLAPNAKGYVPVSFGRKEKWRANRLIYFVYHGELPEGMLVCHSCDRRNCIEINHLFLGTPDDNTQDMLAKGRWANQYVRD